MTIQSKFRKLYQDVLTTKQQVVSLERKLKKECK